MNDNTGGYILHFVIPAGQTGPTGPKSEQSGLETYGGKYNNTNQTITLLGGRAVQIPLAKNMPSSNVNSSNNSITIIESGTYEINYFFKASITVSSALTFAVRNNGTNISSATITKNLSVGTNEIYSGSTIVSLSEGNVIDLAISALLAASVSLGNGVNASLSLKRIN